LLGFLFLRLAPKARKAREERLRAMLARARDLGAAAKSTGWEIVGAIASVLEGFKAPSLASPGPYVYLDRYVFAIEDEGRLRALVAEKDTIYTFGVLDVRFVYLLGTEILGTMGKRRPLKEAVRWMFDDLGMIEHDAIVTLFLEYVGKPMAKDLPLKWFRAHADYARPILARSKDERAKGIVKLL
jgi:hypothetical protein